MRRLKDFLLRAVLSRTPWRFVAYQRYTQNRAIGVLLIHAKSPSVYDPAHCADAFATLHVGPHQWQFLKQYPIELIPKPSTQEERAASAARSK